MKMIKKLVISLTMAALVATNVITAYAKADDVDIMALLNEFSDETKCASQCVAVVDNGEVHIYGDGDGLYQIGSMTKAFTGLAVAKLIKEGKLKEDNKVADLLPGYTAIYDSKPCDITIEQLLTQTSGYTNEETKYPSASADMTLQDWVLSISGKELSSAPGEKYSYSNVNFNLLGAVIEKVSGISYREYMEKEILIPLGLNDTYVSAAGQESRIIPGSKLMYRRAVKYEIPVTEGRIPAGYFYSCGKDMARWIQIWLGSADIPDEYRELAKHIKSKFNNVGDYHSGWELFDGGIIGHSGGTPNYSSRIVYSDKANSGVCVLTNMNVAASTDGLCNGIFKLITGEGDVHVPADVWTVFDIIFTIYTVTGLLLLLIIILCRHRRALIIMGIVMAVLLVTICIVMPLIFGAGLGEIALIWAPYSFAGGLVLMAAAIFVLVVKLRIMRKDVRIRS